MQNTRQHGWLPLMAVMAFSTNARASEDATGFWTSGALSGAIGDSDSRWLYSAEVHARYFDLGSGINQWLVRPAVGYALGKNVRGWIGYSRYRTRSRSGNVADEDRYWQQLDWKAGAFAGGNLSLRGRLEQRDASISAETRNVARLMVKYARPFNNGGPQSLVLAAESYFDLNTTDWGGDTGLAQSRLYGGLEWRLGERTSLETGYMRQHLQVESGVDLVNHLGIVAINTRLR